MASLGGRRAIEPLHEERVLRVRFCIIITQYVWHHIRESTPHVRPLGYGVRTNTASSEAKERIPGAQGKHL